jgi:hypothetical protein
MRAPYDTRAYPEICVNGHKVVEIPKEKLWSWHEKRKRKKRMLSIQLLDTIDFHGLTQDEVAGQDGLKKILLGAPYPRYKQRGITGAPTRPFGAPQKLQDFKL